MTKVTKPPQITVPRITRPMISGRVQRAATSRRLGTAVLSIGVFLAAWGYVTAAVPADRA